MQFLFYFLIISFSLMAAGGLFIIGWGIRKAIRTHKSKENDYDINMWAIIGGLLIFYAFSSSIFFMIQ